MKRISIFILLISATTAMARNEVDHHKNSQKCPSGYLYKLTEINSTNKTTTFSCVADSGKVHPDYKFRIANWRSGDYLLEQNIGKIKTRFTYNNEGKVNSVTQSINGVDFSNKCNFRYEDGSLVPAKDDKCREVQSEFGNMTTSIKHEVFCEPNATESACTTGDGRVFRPSTKETGVLRYFYEKGHVVDEVQVDPKTGKALSQ
ncbi:hypothetical protein [Halobacteriovorax sp. DPLXC-1]|uniref:hypothetical protein n=1 Tax=Halobacteriovorax sp. DPLXC-1 TaxID=3110771 RepID=UPI002FF37E00